MRERVMRRNGERFASIEAASVLAHRLRLSSCLAAAALGDWMASVRSSERERERSREQSEQKSDGSSVLLASLRARERE